MARILIAYSTVDGHTVKICRRLQRLLEKDGHSARLADISASPNADLASYDKLVIGASIRYGKHREDVFRFIKAHHRFLEQKPSAFFSVNVVARKPGKDTPETNPYVRAFRRRTAWVPTESAVFAGKIDYPEYGPLDRLMIRFIMWLTHGPTDPTASVEFTDWAAVDAFAQRISRM
jgi:menaquinone-dependent protoporphyrinogen oxidase